MLIPLPHLNNKLLVSLKADMFYQYFTYTKAKTARTLANNGNE
jgi:hypothetical protein